MRILRCLPAIATVAFPYGLAEAADQSNPSFYLINRDRQTITEVYVSPVTAQGWGRDRLGDRQIAPNGNAPIRLLADGRCLFDLRVVYEDGHDEQRRGVNTCNTDKLTFGAAARSSTVPAPNDNPGRDPSFRVVNQGDREIDEIYARVSGEGEWGRDRLGDAVIESRNYRVIELPYGRCFWDIRLTFEDGQSTEKRRLNLCEITDLPVP